MSSVRARELKLGDKVCGLGVFKSIGTGGAKYYVVNYAMPFDIHGDEYMKISFASSDSYWMVPREAYIELAPVNARYYYDDRGVIEAPYPPEMSATLEQAVLVITEDGLVVKNSYGKVGKIS